jgi:hypothetical protein
MQLLWVWTKVEGGMMTKESSGTIAGDDDVKDRAAEEKGIWRRVVCSSPEAAPPV